MTPKRPVYRKELNSVLFVKIYPDGTAIIVEPENLFRQASIRKEQLSKDKTETLITCLKHDFLEAYRTARKALRVS